MSFNPNRLTPYAFLAPAAAVLIVALLYPIGYMIYASFLDWNPSQRIGEADWVGLRNYTNLLADPNFRESFGVTLIFASVVVSLEMILGVGLALLLDREIRGMSALRTVFILPMMIAPIVVGLMWRYMYHPSVGIINRTLERFGFEPIPWLSDPAWALPSVIIADIWQWTPFIFILALAALQTLPKSVMEASTIDGATPWQQVWHIKIPLMMPVLIIAGLLRLIDAFKVLEVILVMTNGGRASRPRSSPCAYRGRRASSASSAWPRRCRTSFSCCCSSSRSSCSCSTRPSRRARRGSGKPRPRRL